MPTLELLTYTVDSHRINDTAATPSLHQDNPLESVGSLRPDIIALQGIDSESIMREAKGLPVNCLIGGAKLDKAFLSRHPLSRLQTHTLGYGGDCISVDMTFCGKLIHLINLQLSEKPAIRFQQLRTLVGPEVIGKRRSPGTLLVTGDFGGPLIHPTSLLIALYLKQGFRFPLKGDYPAKFPIINRNRLYYRGGVQPVSATPISVKDQKAENKTKGIGLRAGTVEPMGPGTKTAKHLPVRYIIRINDPLSYVKEEQPSHAKAFPARP